MGFSPPGGITTMPYLACKDLGMCQAGFIFFSTTRNFPWGVLKSKTPMPMGKV
jgi:hypothetical protein